MSIYWRRLMWVCVFVCVSDKAGRSHWSLLVMTVLPLDFLTFLTRISSPSFPFFHISSLPMPRFLWSHSHLRSLNTPMVVGRSQSKIADIAVGQVAVMYLACVPMLHFNLGYNISALNNSWYRLVSIRYQQTTDAGGELSLFWRDNSPLYFGTFNYLPRFFEYIGCVFNVPLNKI